MAGSAIFNGTDAIGRYHAGAPIFTALPLTFAGWVQSAASQAKDFLQTGDPASNIRFHGIRQQNANAAVWSNSVLASGGAFNTGGVVFQSVVGVVTTGGLTIYLGGSSVGTDPTAQAIAAGLADITAGATATLSVVFFAGKLSHLSIHTAAFTAADCLRHAAGVSASQLPSCFAWYPLEANGNDLIGGRNMTLSNVTFSAQGPTINYGADPTSVMRNPDRTPDSTPQDRQRLLRRNKGF